jgi:phosphate transport system substrate-binding protein
MNPGRQAIVSLAACLIGLAVLSPCARLEGQVLKVNGSTTVNLPAAEAAEILRSEKGMQIQIDTLGGSSGGISMLGDGRVEVGMTSKPVSDGDRAHYPQVDFHPVSIGEDAVALIVSRDVWDGGVHSLTAEQMRGIYEGRITNWNEVGGPALRIAFFNKEPGRGTWEVFAHWLYGNSKEAPQVSFAEVGGNEETRNKVASTRGALSQLSSSWVDGNRVYALAIQSFDGELIEPLPENIVSGKYPMSRPLFVVTNGPARGPAAVFIEFLLSPRGQELVRKHGYLSLAQLQSS